MAEWNAALRHLARRLLGVTPDGEERGEEVREPLSGAAAGTVVEGAITGAVEADGARDLPEAMGRAAMGLRAAAFVIGEEWSPRTLGEAVERHLPLVVHLQSSADHQPFHAAAGCGAFTLVAADAQEVVDFTLLARRVAEEALVPVVVALDRETAREEAEVRLPSASRLNTLLGRPDDWIHPPDAAQEHLFGKHRRRVPRLHDPEHPAAWGAPRAGAPRAAAALARHAYLEPRGEVAFTAAVEALTPSTAPSTDRRAGSLSLHRFPRRRRPEVVLVAMGSAVRVAEAVSDTLADLTDPTPRIGVLGLRRLRPFPAAEVVEALRGVPRVVVLERVEAPSAPEGPLTLELRAAFSRAVEDGLAPARVPRLRSVLYGLGGQPLRPADLEELCRRADSRDLPRYLGIDGAPDLHGDPKRQAILDPLLRAYPQVAGMGLKAIDPETATAAADPLPAEARRVFRQGRGAELPAFWNRVGALYRRGKAADLVPDPPLALGLEPALSATLRGRRNDSGTRPIFDPGPCTGCGVCWSICPEGAVRPAVAGARAFLESGLQRAAASGQAVAPLRMVLGGLAGALEEELTASAAGGDGGDGGGTGGGQAGALLDAAMAKLLARTPLPEERKAAVEAAFAALRRELASVPLAHTAIFFGESADAAGGRDLFSLTIDPDACTGCGLCVAECEPGALTAAPADFGREEDGPGADLTDLTDLTDLMDPAPETLERAVRGGLNPLAAALLPATHREILAVGSGAEPGSGEAIALRQVLGAASFHLQPQRRQWTERLEALGQELAAAIHRALEGALPDRDLDALAQGLEGLEGLEALGRSEVGLAELSTRVEEALTTPQVDVVRLRRLVAAARAVADLGRAWKVGAPLTVVVAGDLAGDLAGGRVGSRIGGRVGGRIGWIGGFPYNVFAPPVAFAPSGELAGLARGLAAGHRERTLEAVATLRHARRLLDASERAMQETSDEPEALRWEDLSTDERRLCPPLVVIAPEASLPAGDLLGALELAAEDLPVKILLPADPGLDETDAPHWPSFGPTSVPEGIWVQTSIAHPEHLEAGVAAAFRNPEPAVIRLYAPCPGRHGFAPDETLRRVRDAVTSRLFPLFPRDAAPDSALPEAPREPELSSESTPTAAPTAEREAAWRAEIAHRLRRRLVSLMTSGDTP